MERIGPDGARSAVTNSTGDVDRDGEIVDALEVQARRAINLARTSLDETGIVAPAVWEFVDECLDELLWKRVGTAPDPGRYRERLGLDDRLAEAGADPDEIAGIRRALRCPS